MVRRHPAVTAGLALALCVLTAAGLPGQAGPAPTFKEVNGFDFGERITLHHQMVRYLERLAAASPRVTVVDQGESWEGRRLLLAIVTAPENHARLDAIRETARRIADPRATPAGDVAALVRDQPAIVWIGGSIHGFELSGSEGVLKLLEHLATRNDQTTQEVLRHTVVLIDPMLNPDGRDAFATTNQQHAGREPNPLREDWGNDFVSWEALKFRTGHYFFDTNRDWFAHTQNETRYRVPTLQAWRPQVVIDAHEMGPDIEFYFDPPTEPVSPYFPEFSTRWLERFGEAYARAFDAAQFDYTTRELYNFFYPGYTTSYGSFLGGAGMLYEQGSSRGLALMRRDGTMRTLADALRQQYTAAWTAVQLAARERETLLREFHESYRAAIEDGGRGTRRYVLGPGGDPSLIAELADLLRRNGIEVGMVTEPATLTNGRDRAGRSAGGHAVGPGALVVEAAQPRNRLIRVLLEPDVPVPAAFLEQARARVDRAENPRFYDITAWSLPLLFNVEASSGGGEGRLATRPLGDDQLLTPEVPPQKAAYAYILDGRQAGVMAAAYHLRHLDHRASVALKPTRVAGRDVPGGSVVVRVRSDADRVHEDVREIAGRYGLNLSAVDTGEAAEEFTALAATHVVSIVKPEVALLAEQPVQAYSFGWAWYTLDQQYRVPVTVLRVRSVAATPIDRFNAIVLPEVTSQDELAAVLGEPGLERLRRWVQDGGTLVAIGSGVDFVRERLKLIALRSWYDVRQEDGQERGRGEPVRRIATPGAIFRGVLDPESWLSAGYTGDLPVLVNSSRLYVPPEGPPSLTRRVAVRYATEPPVRLSGHAWDETLERLPGTVMLYEERVGRGRVVTFSEDPNFRGYWRGANRLFLNAVLLGPSAP